MRIYLDLDCLEKLAACGLLDDILKRLGASHEDVFIVKSFKYSWKSKANAYKKAGKKELAESYERVASIMESFSLVSLDTEGLRLADALNGIEKIDAGEQTLAAAAATCPEKCLLLTSDSNFVSAIVQAYQKQGKVLRPFKKMKILHLYQILEWLCSKIPYDELYKKMTTKQATDCDIVIARSFFIGADIKKTKESLTEAINGFPHDFCIKIETLP